MGSALLCVWLLVGFIEPSRMKRTQNIIHISEMMMLALLNKVEGPWVFRAGVKNDITAQPLYTSSDF